MKRRPSFLKHVKATYLCMDLLWLVLGILLLLFPQVSSSLICRGLGLMCLIYGVVKLAGYFSKDPYRLAFQFDLALGVFCIILGLALLLFTRALLSFLPVIVGLFTVVAGVFKLQTAFEARRFGLSKWWGLLAMSILVIVIGCLLLLRPFQSALLAIRLMGLSLVLDGIQDLITTAYTVDTRPKDTIIDVDDFWEV